MSTLQRCVTVESVHTSTVSLSDVVTGGRSGKLSTAVYCIKISFLTRGQILVNHSLFTHSCRGNGSVNVSRGEKTVEMSALRMVNTHSFASHSSPVMNLYHNFGVHVTLLTLDIHIKFSQISYALTYLVQRANVFWLFVF